MLKLEVSQGLMWIEASERRERSQGCKSSIRMELRSQLEWVFGSSLNTFVAFNDSIQFARLLCLYIPDEALLDQLIFWVMTSAYILPPGKNLEVSS
jgi:hypothetical protein